MYIKPKTIKYIKIQKNVLKTFVSIRNTKKQNYPLFNFYSIFAKETSYLIDKHLETAKKVLKLGLINNNLFIIRVFPNKAITKKPLGVRIGKGKGAVSNWVTPVQAGTVLFEIKYISFTHFKKVFFTLQKKIPLVLSFKQKKQPLF